MRSFLLFGFFVFFLGLTFNCVSQVQPTSINIPKGIKHALQVHQRAKIWADSVFNTLNADERIGQLLMMAAYSNKGKEHRQQVERWVTETKIGGLIWMQGSPSKQLEFSQALQVQAKVPLLYAMDAEWGLSMRLDSTIKYPRQMTLGAIQNHQLIYEFGTRMAYECRRMGIHVSFSPVLDINNNPKNPVIGTRSFGSDPQLVIDCGAAYMRGLQEHGVLATGKHFPGHGDTETDSHTGLPVIPYSKNRLDSLELKPFKALVEQGIGSLMIAHLHLPKLDATPFLPSTLSRTIVTGILRNEWNYAGLLFTDALNMSGVRAHFKPGEIEVMALRAGNDILLFSENPKQAIEHIKSALQQGVLLQEELDAHCKRVLEVKYKYCILKPQTEITDLDADLNSADAKDLNSTLYEHALTLLKSESGFLPLGINENKKILCISIGAEPGSVFFKRWKKFSRASEICVSPETFIKNNASLKKQTRAFDQVIIQIAKNVPATQRNGFWKSVCDISKLKPTCAMLFATPYNLQGLSNDNPLKALAIAYEYNTVSEIAAAEALMGAFPIQGKLPVSAGAYTIHSGIDWSPKSLHNSINTQSKAEQIKLRIDSIAQSGIERHAYPGCQVVILQDGKPVYLKAYGHLTYDLKSSEVTMQTLFDLASLTKVLSTSLALMRLKSQNQFDYHKPLMAYLPHYLKKGHLKIEDVLTHQAGLKAWIPFYKEFLDSSQNLRPGYCSRTASGTFTCSIAENLYTSKCIRDSIMQIIEASALGPKKYLYSDLGYYYMQEIIEGVCKKPLDVFVSELYSQMGLGLTYNPLQKHKRPEIAPTEFDDGFRKQLVHGHVHDPGAALNGGVAGHAGLFGNALDVAKLMDMFLHLGRFENQYILDSNVVKTFTRKAYFNGNRRALCFDKPEPNAKKKSPVTDLCSMESFGHSGFTGTFAWADPKSNLVFVFLSNRVYPDAENPLLVRLKIRQRIHEQAYALLQAK